MLLIVDIDGTIADMTKRLNEAGKEPSRHDMAAYQQWVDRIQNEVSLAADPHNKELLLAITDLHNQYWEVVYLTGRSEKYRPVTKSWLNEKGFPPGKLIMRGNTDWRSAKEYKQEHVNELVRQSNCVIAIDDDLAGDCSDMYRSMGITHLKVMHSHNGG